MSNVCCYFLGPHRIASAAEEVWQHSIIRECPGSITNCWKSVYLSGRGGWKGEIQQFQLAERVAVS